MFLLARASARVKSLAVTTSFAKQSLAFLSCRSAQVKPMGMLTQYFKSDYFEGGVFSDQSYKRVYVGETEQWFYEHEASGIKVWEHARLP